MAAALVVDTSVLVKWFKDEDEELLVEAIALRDRVDRTGADVYVPALLMYEVGNILTRKSGLDDAGVAGVLEAIGRSRLTIAPPAPELLGGAARLARAYDISFYDAAFVALAAALDCPLVTADRRLADRTRRLGYVKHLGAARNTP